MNVFQSSYDMLPSNLIQSMKIYILLLIASCGSERIILKQKSGGTFFGDTWKVKGKCSPSWVKEGMKWVTYNAFTRVFDDNNCYLYSNYWLVASDVKLVFINVYGEGRSCTSISVTGYICSDQVNFKAYIGKVDGATNIDSYENISLLPKSKLTSKFYNYNETFSVDVSGKTALKLMFHTKYYFGEIHGVNMYYYNCPSVSKELVEFTSKKAPDRDNSPSTIRGKCIANSVQITSQLYMKCHYNGSYTVHGHCSCDKGFKLTNTSKCQECGGERYKPNIGNEKCKPCGKNARSKGGGVSCSCITKYYRNIGKEKEDQADCYRPPDKPKNVIVRNITENSAIVQFEKPDEIGDGALGYYVVNCTNCQHNEKFPLFTKSSPLNMTGLGSLATYQLIIYNRNSITNRTGKYNHETFNLTTIAGGKPGRITDFTYKRQSDGSVVLKWKAPFVKGGTTLTYILLYGSVTKETSKTTYTIASGSTSQEYKVQIYARAIVNGRKIDGEVYISDTIAIKGGIPLRLTIGVVVAIIIVIIIISLVLAYIWRKRNPPLAHRMEDGTVIHPSRFLPGSKLYIDPTTYSDVDDAVEQFAYEIGRDKLTMEKLIGGGEFAEVYTGTLTKSSGKVTNVAIKTLKSGAGKKDRDDFLSEAAILGQFSDTNVITLEGVVMKDRPHLIVLEFMANGSLDQYLQKNDMQFQVIELLGMARCVASGMAYLSDMGFIHRDLAARNILVDEHNICKISDFGMSRELKLDDTYETQGGKIPVRWTAPEAIQFKKFTSASDCWSYGILLWEIMSYGERPYWDWGNYTVLERLNAGYRLPPPMNCRKVIHNLMLECWNKDRTKRPRFKDMREKIEQWIRSPELLAEIASVVTKTDENLDYTVLETIHKWLEAIGMEQYTETFLNNNYTTPKQILDMVDNDLIRIGITPIGHRKKILKATRNTRNQVEARHRGGSVNDSMRKKTFSLSRKK